MLHIGGATYTTGGRAASARARVHAWRERAPERVHSMLPQARTRARAVSGAVAAFGLDEPARRAFAAMHERLARAILDRIERSHEPHTESQDTHPPNYTETMSRLKNIRFAGWDASAIRGFCPLEPGVRVAELLTFPVERFDPTWQLAELQLPAPPGEPEHGATELVTAADIEDALDAPELDAWELYYEDVARAVAAWTLALDA